MGKMFPLEPREVPRVNTKYRKIVTKFPVPQSVKVFEKLRNKEPISMTGQPPVLWHKAVGCQVYDRWGNKWLDWSSGVLVANAGHGRKEVAAAVARQARVPMLHSYCFVNEPRAELVEFLAKLSPPPLKKVFLLTTGAETTECAIKLCRTWGLAKGGKGKLKFVTFNGAFHGRTMGAQLAGGIPALKNWLPDGHPDFVQVDFPGDLRCKDRSFDAFERALKEKGVEPDSVCGVMSETYQGGSAALMPVEFAKALRAWCDKHGVLLVFDEVQAGFGRTGTMFGFEHYGIVPDLMCLGKGISSSLPISALIGREDVMNQYGPGEMTSTHTGNPVCAAAALANLKVIVRDKLHKNAARVGDVLHRGLNEMMKKHPDRIGGVMGKGLVAGMHMVVPGTDLKPDPDLAFNVVRKSAEKGLLFFAPVGFGGATVKIAPPLTITKEQIEDGLQALGEAVDEAIAEIG